MEWPWVIGARSYIVNVIEEATGEITNSEETLENRTRIIGLEPGLVYHFVVYSVGAGGRKTKSGNPTVTQQTGMVPTFFV